jgi:hypothetical protein
VIAGVPAKVVRSYDPETGWLPPQPEVPLDEETLAQIAELTGDRKPAKVPEPGERAS